MTEPQAPQPPEDNLWSEFSAAEAASAERLEQQYQVIEGYNATMLNQVAGLEDTRFEIIGEITDDGIDPTRGPSELIGKPFMSLLYLRPDRRAELFDQGESPDNIENNGNPYVIRGPVPPRTQKLIDDLLSSTESVKDEKESTETKEVWKGNVAGQPIEFDIRRNKLKIVMGDKEKEVPTLTMHVVRPTKDFPTEVGKSAVEAAVSAGVRVIDEEGNDITDASLDGLGETTKNAAEDALGKVKRMQGRREFWNTVKRRMHFPDRRNY